jgi:acyl-CoA synthetase (NDP forming)
MGLGAGAAYANPVDLPQPVLVARQGRDTEAILRVIFDREEPQAVIVHVNLSVVMSLVRDDDDPLADLIEAAVRVKDDYPGKAHFVLVLRSDGSLAFETARIRYRAKALQHAIPTYDELPAAANAVAAIAHHEKFLSR